MSYKRTRGRPENNPTCPPREVPLDQVLRSSRVSVMLYLVVRKEDGGSRGHPSLRRTTSLKGLYSVAGDGYVRTNRDKSLAPMSGASGTRDPTQGLCPPVSDLSVVLGNSLQVYSISLPVPRGRHVPSLVTRGVSGTGWEIGPRSRCRDPGVPGFLPWVFPDPSEE